MLIVRIVMMIVIMIMTTIMNIMITLFFCFLILFSSELYMKLYFSILIPWRRNVTSAILTLHRRNVTWHFSILTDSPALGHG
jgi:hypothetical protein